jgi:hypothetical protein
MAVRKTWFAWFAALLMIATMGLMVAAASSASAAPKDAFVRMNGAMEVPGPGDPQSRGAAFINLHSIQGRVCAGVRFTELSTPLTGMHIHTGARGVQGPIVVNLNAVLAGTTRCVTGVDSQLIQDIRSNPNQYYLNVHNEEFPAGAIRGQLNRSQVESPFRLATGPTRQFARMNGAQEAPGPGDPDGRGAAFIDVNADAGEVCADVRWTGIDEPTGMHIHRGAWGVQGPIVVGFFSPGPGTRCVAADPDLVREIRDEPREFYLNVHTGPFPAGAIRGQLERSMARP